MVRNLFSITIAKTLLIFGILIFRKIGWFKEIHQSQSKKLRLKSLAKFEVQTANIVVMHGDHDFFVWASLIVTQMIDLHVYLL